MQKTILCWLVALGMAVLLLPVRGEAASLHGGFWSTEPSFVSTLVLNNPVAEKSDVRLILYSNNGVRLLVHEFRVGPKESRRIPLSDLVAFPASGSLELEVPDAKGLFPAQVQVQTANSIWFHELIDDRLFGDGLEGFVGLIPVLDSSDTPQARLILTNVDRRATRGRIVLRTASGVHTMPFAVGPRQVRQVDLTARELAGTDLAEVTVIPQGPGSLLLVSGFAGSVELMLPLHFEPQIEDRTRQIAAAPPTAFFTGGESLLLLSNPSPRQVTASLTARSMTSSTTERAFTIPAQGFEVLPVHKFLGLSAGARGVISLDSQADLAAQLLTRNPRPLLSLLKAPAGSPSLAYSFPVRLDTAAEAEETVVDLYNPGPEALEMFLVAHFADRQFQYPLPSPVGAGELLSVNLSEAQRQGLVDAHGRKLPEGPTTGQAVVMLHPDADQGRFLARARLTRAAPSTRTPYDYAFLESCVTCPDGVVQMTVSPDPIVGNVGSQTSVGVLLTLESGIPAFSFPDFAFTTNPFVADVIGSPSILSFLAPGTTSIEAEKEACLFYEAEMFGPFQAGCGCALSATFFDSGTVQSIGSPTITSINPSRGLIGQKHTVTLEGSGFGLILL